MDSQNGIPDQEVTELRDHTVIDVDGHVVGKIRDVLFDDGGQPQWAVVSTGGLGGARYVPLTNAYNSDEGRVVVSFRKDTIKRSPKAGKDHVVDPVLERELTDHYFKAA